MTTRFLSCFFLALVLATAAHAQAPEPNQALRDAEATLVIYNSGDPDAAPLARFYAEQRHIPEAQVISLMCSTKEEITREEYDRTIAVPLRALFDKNGWWTLRAADHFAGPVQQNRIRYVVLIRGMPLKIAAAPDLPNDKPDPSSPIGSHNEASVDSELATLGTRSTFLSGAVNNKYFRAMGSIFEAKRDEMMLVCRLDGPTPTIVRRMITDSIAVEQKGLRGMAYIDARGLGEDQPGLIEGDQWMLASAGQLLKLGLPVIMDNGAQLFPEGYPMRHVAYYLGWWIENVDGPFVEPGFRFEPGAVVVHLHSFSGSTVRDPNRHWVGPILQRGAAATLGNVYEPYLALTPHLNIFTERLRLGFNFAESAYMSMRVLSWMTTVVGDPLYRPFKALESDGAVRTDGSVWEAYAFGAKKFAADPAAGAAELAFAARERQSGELWEALALLQIAAGQREDALRSLAEARTTYKEPADALRVTIHEIIQLRQARREPEVEALTRTQAAKYAGAPAISVLKMLAPRAFTEAPAPAKSSGSGGKKRPR